MPISKFFQFIPTTEKGKKDYAKLIKIPLSGPYKTEIALVMERAPYGAGKNFGKGMITKISRLFYIKY